MSYRKVMQMQEVRFSLKDLREAKNLSQAQLAQALKMSRTMYAHIESGQRKPTADNVYVLSLIYKTSMDFIYHAYHKQILRYYLPDDDLKYAMREAQSKDIIYLQEEKRQVGPEVPRSIISGK